jgi:hypothetical protein
MSSPDTASYDRLFAKEAAFTTVSIPTLSLQSLNTALITALGSELIISAPTFVTVNAPIVRSNGAYLHQATFANDTFTGTVFGDTTLRSDGNFYIGTVEPSESVVISSQDRIVLRSVNAIVIGGNSYPKTSGASGQVLTSNGLGDITWSSVAGTGTVTSVGLTSSSSFITVTGASPITSAGAYALDISGALPTANGGTGTTTFTGTGSNVLQTAPTFITSITTPSVISPSFSVAGNMAMTAGSGELTLTSSSFLNLNGAATRINGGTFISAGTGTSGGNGFTGVTVPVNGTSFRGENQVYMGSSGSEVQILSAGGGGIYANGRRIDIAAGSYAMYGGSSPMPEARTSYKPPNTIATSGPQLTYNPSNGNFTNNTGATRLVTIGYSCSRESNAFGATGFGVELNGAGARYAMTTVGGIDWSSASTVLLLPNGEFFRVVSDQSSGSGNNYAADSTLYYSF